MLACSSAEAYSRLHSSLDLLVFEDWMCCGSFALEPNTVNKLLAALNECTEWGQVFILESISSYSPNNDSQAESIIERVTPRLQHANCAVVLSAVKVIVSQLEVCPPVNRINESFPQPTI